MSLRVLLDANVLFSDPLRRLLFACAAADLLALHWTLQILDEACGSLVRTGRLTGETARALHTQLGSEHPEALITDYEALTDAMQNHPGDRHVAAAAAHAGIGWIVTRNLHDFRKLPEGIAAISPDALLLRLLEAQGPAMADVLRAESQRYGSADAMVADLRKIVPRFAKRLSAPDAAAALARQS